MAMDGGADGIVAPYVETVEQVKELVGAVKYRPIKGKFLADILSGERKPNEKLQRFFGTFNRDKYLIIGVESVEAIENLEKLLSVEGVDGVFLGPHDITCSMEIPEEYDNPLFHEAMIKVVRTCKKMNKGVGLHSDAVSPFYRQLMDEGLNYVLNAAEVTKMRSALNGDFDMLRGEYGDTYSKNLSTEKENDSCISKNAK
jgi:4-hydroxy-2-oxoheptanedioate aldolase